MNWLAVIAVCSVGMWLIGDKKDSTTVTKKEPEKYSREWCKENLNRNYYDNYNCDDVADQLKDNWKRQEIESLQRRGYSFTYAIDHMVDEGKIKL